MNRSALYLVRHQSVKTKIEILINDMLFIKSQNFDTEKQSFQFINHLLRNSKKQKITIKLYPLDEELFDEHSRFRIELSMFNKKIDWDTDNFDNHKVLLDYNSSKTKVDSFEKIDKLEDKNYFEKEFTFTIDQELADTSPNLNALAKNLSAVDTTLLKKQLLKKYRQLVSSVKQQDRTLFNKIYSGKTKLFAQYNQLNKEEIEGLKEEADFIFKETELILNDDIEMFFYGNDRIISLENIKDRKPALSFKYKAENNNYYSIEMPLYFYIPKDSTELKILY